jgi:hypothetical protein
MHDYEVIYFKEKKTIMKLNHVLITGVYYCSVSVIEWYMLQYIQRINLTVKDPEEKNILIKNNIITILLYLLKLILRKRWN